MSSALQRQKRTFSHNRFLQHQRRNRIVAKTKRRRTKTYRFRQPLLKRRREENSVGELELLAMIFDFERFRFHLHGKQIQLFSDHQALKALLKTKQNQ